MTAPARPLRPDQAYGLKAFGKVVRRARLDVGVSQHTLARAVGVNQSVISRLETGKLNGLRLHHLGSIVALLDGHVEYWIGYCARPAGRRLPGSAAGDANPTQD